MQRNATVATGQRCALCWLEDSRGESITVRDILQLQKQATISAAATAIHRSMVAETLSRPERSALVKLQSLKEGVECRIHDEDGKLLKLPRSGAGDRRQKQLNHARLFSVSIESSGHHLS
jgi:hypothetical protein